MSYELDRILFLIPFQGKIVKYVTGVSLRTNQIKKLFFGQTSITNDGEQGARSDILMTRNSYKPPITM